MSNIINSNIINTLKKYQSCMIFLDATTTPALQVGKCKKEFGVHPKELNILKHTTMNCLIGTKVDYATLVQNRLIKEADLKGCDAKAWTKEERRWGERIDGVHVTHKGKNYVTIHCVAANKPQVRYEIDGKEADAETITKIKNCFSDTKSKKQADAGVEKPVVYRDFGIDSINAIRVSGKTIID